MSVSYGKLVKDIKNVRLEMFILPATAHFTSIFIDSDEVFDAGDVGKLVKCGEFEGSYVMQIESPKHALISWHPDNYAQHQGVPCSLYEFKEMEHRELVAMTLARDPLGALMNTDELCKTIEGLPDDTPTLGSLVIFDIGDLKALVRELAHYKAVVDATTEICVYKNRQHLTIKYRKELGWMPYVDTTSPLLEEYPSLLEAYDAFVATTSKDAGLEPPA